MVLVLMISELLDLGFLGDLMISLRFDEFRRLGCVDGVGRL